MGAGGAVGWGWSGMAFQGASGTDMGFGVASGLARVSGKSAAMAPLAADCGLSVAAIGEKEGHAEAESCHCGYSRGVHRGSYRAECPGQLLGGAYR